MIKQIVLYVFFVASASGCSRIVTQEPLFIDSNVSADVYSGDKKIGTTPFLVTLKPKATENLSLQRKGYKTQQVKIQKKVISYLDSVNDETNNTVGNIVKDNLLSFPIVVLFMFLFADHPATYAQHMYYIEMQPQK